MHNLPVTKGKNHVSGSHSCGFSGAARFYRSNPSDGVSFRNCGLLHNSADPSWVELSEAKQIRMEFFDGSDGEDSAITRVCFSSKDHSQ